MRRLLAAELVRSGYEVVECRSGFDLLCEIDPQAPPGRRIDFDLVISDIRMPGITGLFFLEGMHQWDRPRPLPIILITAFGDEETHARARELGAAAIFDKPFEIAELMNKVCEVAPPPRRTPDGRFCPERTSRVLLAEDDPELRDLVAWRLTQERYEVTECVDGLELLSKLGTFASLAAPLNPDLVISDVRMGAASALDVLEAMRGCARLPPVILITAFADARTRREADRLGVAAVLDKPIDLDELAAKVRELLDAPGELAASRGAETLP